MTIIYNLFYFTYFDTIKGKQIVKRKYKSKAELIDNIIKSLYVPYLIDRRPTDNDGCIDGAFPYMFKSRTRKRKILFLNLQSMDKFKKMIFIKNEKNIGVSQIFFFGVYSWIQRQIRGERQIKTNSIALCWECTAGGCRRTTTIYLRRHNINLLYLTFIEIHINF